MVWSNLRQSIPFTLPGYPGPPWDLILHAAGQTMVRSHCHLDQKLAQKVAGYTCTSLYETSAFTSTACQRRRRPTGRTFDTIHEAVFIDEEEHGVSMCRVRETWDDRLGGIILMEIGSEIIMCSFDWQAIADVTVERYSHTLGYLASP